MTNHSILKCFTLIEAQAAEKSDGSGRKNKKTAAIATTTHSAPTDVDEEIGFSSFSTIARSKTHLSLMMTIACLRSLQSPTEEPKTGTPDTQYMGSHVE